MEFGFNHRRYQPSIEDVLLGAIPGLPKVHLTIRPRHENGDDFMKFWYGEKGQLSPCACG
jgi:hydrogenase small subunit